MVCPLRHRFREQILASMAETVLNDDYVCLHQNSAKQTGRKEKRARRPTVAKDSTPARRLSLNGRSESAISDLLPPAAAGLSTNPARKNAPAFPAAIHYPAQPKRPSRAR